MPIDPDLRTLLVCPTCRGELSDRDDGLACTACERLYPVEDGVPFLVTECARPLEPKDAAGG